MITNVEFSLLYIVEFYNAILYVVTIFKTSHKEYAQRYCEIRKIKLVKEYEI